MPGRFKSVNTHSYKYYPIRPKIPQHHYHGNPYNNTQSVNFVFKEGLMSQPIFICLMVDDYSTHSGE
jgi:hypothetical protein